MSDSPTNDANCTDAPSPAIELLIEGRARDLGGGMVVRRTLPAIARRRVGPFVFFDQMGPVDVPPGLGFDVRPHPHIALATVTFLFEGEILHRDSLGSKQAIRPGDVNWMVAGRGIVHSERASDEARRAGQRLHGIQCWVGLPTELEEAEPRFEHHPAASIPRVTSEDSRLDVIAGTAYGLRSPAGVLSPTLYVHGRLEAGALLTIEDEHEERALYVVEGEVECDGCVLHPGTMAVLRPGGAIAARARSMARVMLLGGAPLVGERHMFWNFISSSKERLELAKRDWAEERFPTIEGDDQERIPLPPG